MATAQHELLRLLYHDATNGCDFDAEILSGRAKGESWERLSQWVFSVTDRYVSASTLASWFTPPEAA